MDSVLSTLKRFDAYPKTLDDVRIKTYAGATGTLPAHPLTPKKHQLAPAQPLRTRRADKTLARAGGET